MVFTWCFTCAIGVFLTKWHKCHFIYKCHTDALQSKMPLLQVVVCIDKVLVKDWWPHKLLHTTAESNWLTALNQWSNQRHNYLYNNFINNLKVVSFLWFTCTIWSVQQRAELHHINIPLQHTIFILCSIARHCHSDNLQKLKPHRTYERQKRETECQCCMRTKSSYKPQSDVTLLGLRSCYDGLQQAACPS